MSAVVKMDAHSTLQETSEAPSFFPGSSSALVKYCLEGPMAKFRTIALLVFSLFLVADVGSQRPPKPFQFFSLPQLGLLPVPLGLAPHPSFAG